MRFLPVLMGIAGGGPGSCATADVAAAAGGCCCSGGGGDGENSRDEQMGTAAGTGGKLGSSATAAAAAAAVVVANRRRTRRRRLRPRGRRVPITRALSCARTPPTSRRVRRSLRPPSTLGHLTAAAAAIRIHLYAGPGFSWFVELVLYKVVVPRRRR